MSDEYQPDEVLETQATPDSAAPKLTSDPAPEPAPQSTVETPVTTESTAVDSEMVMSDEMAEVEETSMEVDSSAVEPEVVELGPSVVRIEDFEAAKRRKQPQKSKKPAKSKKEDTAGDDGARGPSVPATVAAFFAERLWLVGVVLGVAVIAILLLPPVSLVSRLTAGGGYEVLDATTTSLTHPDGLSININPETEGKLRVKLDTVPRADFAGAEVAEDVAVARDALPPYLTPKSPYYMVSVKNKDPYPASMEVLIPNEAEPWETLDLYAWDGEVWRWIPTQLDRDAEVLVANVAALPDSVMVMQSGMVAQKIVVEIEGPPPVEIEPIATDGDLIGMLIGTMGGLGGDATQLPLASSSSNPALVPTVRNWVPDRAPNWALVSDMLNIESDRTAHIQNLVGLAQSGGYQGVVIDYRNLQASDRAVFTSFITDLAAALHEQNMWLGVTVDEPVMNAGVLDTGAYDWGALGKAVDQLRVLMPLSPDAYAPGGFAEQILEWGTSVVDRYKLLPVFSTLSTDGQKTLVMNDLLQPLSNIQVVQVVTDSVEPGTALTFQLGSAALEPDPATGASRLVVGSETAPMWLGTPEWLRSRIDLSARYHLGGVVLRDLLEEGNMPNLISAVADYQAQTESKTYPVPEVDWTMSGPGGQLNQTKTSLAQPQFMWTAPEVTGTYRIAASVSGVNKGSMDIQVSLPVTETVTEGEDALAEGEEDGADDEATVDVAGLVAAFVADVSVPDNTHFEKGEDFTKTWRLRNAGGEDWPKDTKLVFVSGEKMTDVSDVEVGAVSAGDTVDISVDMAAPDQDGTFKGTWTLQAGGQEVSGGAVVVIIKAGEEQAATAAATAPVAVAAPVASGSFELGGHVRDLSLPYGEKMHYSGMNWAKVQVRYGEDAAWIVNVAHANGFKIQLSALGNANMVVEPGFAEKYAQWVAGLASAGADAIEVWNEPNIDREWQIGHISPQSYTNLLCTAYNAIKGANPGSAVISAAPAPTGYFGGCSANGCDDQPWMEGLYNAGAANCMDYIGAHHNSGATAPSARSGHPAGGVHHSWYFLPQTELYYNIFGGSRKLFYTEMGYASQEGVSTFSDQFAWARGINNSQQAAWLAEAVQLGINTGMVRCIIVWNIDFVRYGYDPQDGYAIIRPGGGCPACESLHNVLGSR
ncbi:MAG: hypothetical protein JW981_04675 [Anaerolineae bacterium]|nr:hypothetical protein [Anaerolineae bacterium]